MKEEAVINVLRQVKEVLDKHSVEFWLDGGTLLGAVRNEKIIPWEHDTDVNAWDTDFPDNIKRLVAKELSEKGFETQIFETPTPGITIYDREEDVWSDINFCHLIEDKAIMPRAKTRKLIGTFLLYVSTALLNPHSYEVDFGAKPRIDNLIRGILAKISRILPPPLRKRLAQIVAVVYEKIGLKDFTGVIPAHYFKNLTTITFYGMEFRVPAETEEYLAWKYGESWRIPRRDWTTSRDDGSVINTKWRKRKRASR